MVAQGTTLAGRYRLDTRIGAGGMGEVWRGEDMVLARTVAVKVLLPGRTDDPGFLVRFQGEARAMATINHPGVVDVYDYGVHEVPGAGATAYLVMKFVDGEPLDRLLSRLGSIAPGPAMELISQAASALQAVHDQGIVHRDIKPGNLLVRPDGMLVLTDFGIARSDAASRLTDAGMVLGTAAYCAPEQAEGAPVTPAVDIYALGVVAYECLAGQRPFDGDTPVTIALKHIREAPPPLPPHVPPAVRALVEQALSKDPARRFPSADAMSAAARQAGQLGPKTGPMMLGQPGPPPETGWNAAQAGWQGQSGQQTGWQGQGGQQAGWQGSAPQTGWQGGQQTSQGIASAAATTAASGAAVEAASGGRGRRAGRAPRRRGGMLAAVAAAVVLCGGLGAVGINAMASSDETPDNDRVAEVTTAPSEPPAKTSRPPRPRKTAAPAVTHQQARPTAPTEETEEPEPTEEPTPEATPKNSPKPTPTKSPKPPPTVQKVQVPDVRGLEPGAAKARLAEAGLKVKVTASGDIDYAGCVRVVEQNPAPGTEWDPRKPVEIVLANPKCPESSPPASPAATPKP
ncbi:serine/threonine protein kinase [Streptosporangium sp. NPDC048047]|uniref:serine/threonine protein kinase n=1 Tax=Streptosporangium sp. NPDC048047 TaxID=3155748 RepID=UPI00341989CA